MVLKKEGSVSGKKIIALTSLFLLISGIFATGTEAKSDKVAADVKHLMLKGENVPVIIMLNDRASFKTIPEGKAAAMNEMASEHQGELAVLLNEEKNRGKAYKIKKLRIVNAIAMNASPDLIEKLSMRDDIAGIELDSEVKILEDYSSLVSNEQISSATSEIRRINTTNAWALGIDGSTINVSVIDTGINAAHPDIAGRVIKWVDFVNSNPSAYDDYGHGTHVAGTVGGNGSGGTTTGMAPNVSLFGVKVLNAQGWGYLSDVISGIEWSVDNGADVISMSLGAGSYTTSNCDADYPALTVAINNAVNAGVVVVAAAGNDGSSISMPACIQNAIAAGAVDSTDTAAGFSGRGAAMADHGIVAPGVGITSLYYLTNGYSVMSGTSMATPHVSGAVALILHAAKENGSTLLPSQIKNILEAASLDLGTPGKDDIYGAGRINVFAAVAPSVAANPTIYQATGAARNGTAITLNATVTDSIAGVKNISVNASSINASLSDLQLTYDSGFWVNDSAVVNASDGIYHLNITAYNNMGYANNFTQLSVTVDNTPPVIISTSAIPSQIEAGSGSSVLRANVGDYTSGISQVTVNLSSIGGLSNSPMQNVGGDVWQLTVDTVEVGNFLLSVNATDGAGNVENTNILLNITDTTPPLVDSARASRDSIISDGTDYAILTVRTGDFANVSGIKDVAVNLSRVGGNATQEMMNSSGIWLFNVTASMMGINGTMVRLPVNVTDLHNNSNTSASIILGIKKVISVIPGARTSSNFTIGSEEFNISITAPEAAELSGEPLIAPVDIPEHNNLSYAGVALNISNLSFNEPLRIEMKYNSSLISGDESKLRLWFYNTTASSWEITDNSSVDTLNKTVSGYTSHFSVFAPLADITPPAISGVTESSIGTGSAIISWTTDEASQSLVRYGTGSGAYTLTEENTSNATSHSIQLTGLSAGTRYYYTVSSTDHSGNTANGSERSFTTSSQEGGSGGGGGGGGGGGPSGENATNIEVKEKYDLHIFKDKTTAYAFTNRSNPVLFINITGNISAGEVNAAVEVLRNTSALVKAPAPGMVYRNINIWVGTSGFAVPRNIKNAEVTFRIERDWVDNGGSVVLVRYDTEWVRLPTRKIREDGKFVYYTALTEKFSPFAITMFKAAVPAADAVEGQAANITSDGYSPASPGTTGVQPLEEKDEKHTFWRITVLVAVIPIFFAAVYIHNNIHKRKRR
ncbi:MAG: S8 family serine peptidase [Candidatus Methanoperedens sp.]|nr:S8 family serine peptidase [Candidatus Methanoperedens sp.]